MPVTTVPNQDPGQTELYQVLSVSPYTPAWWQAQVINNIPQDSVGWLVAQGWQITAITYDATTTPPTPYYTMARESIKNWQVLQALLDSYTFDRNDAQAKNAIRYNDVLNNWELLISTSHDHFDAQTDEQNDHANLYVGLLDGYMTDVDNLLDDSQVQLDQVEPDFTVHETTSPSYLLNLGATELARINELFDSTLATQLQQLIDKGLYTSAVAADITARNTRDRNEEIVALNDRLNREKLDNDHKLYEQKASMRGRIIDGTNRILVGKLSQSAAHLGGRQAKHDETMRMMTYQLDERNKLYVGLYGFVERRDDVAPSFEALTQVCTSLGDAGGGWVTP